MLWLRSGEASLPAEHRWASSSRLLPALQQHWSQSLLQQTARASQQNDCNSDPRMQREYCTYTEQSSARTKLARLQRFCPPVQPASALWPRSPDASQQRATHQRIVQDTYRRRGETRTSLLDLASPKPTRAAPREQLMIHNITHYPGRGESPRGVVASTPRARAVSPSRAPPTCPSTAVTVPLEPPLVRRVVVDKALDEPSVGMVRRQSPRVRRAGAALLQDHRRAAPAR